MISLKKISVLTLLFVLGAGFTFLDDFMTSKVFMTRLEAAKKSKKSSKKSKKSEKKSEKSEDTSSKSEDNGLLIDNEKSKDYMPEIFRCPDCGYEQDEEGVCPDHTTLKLVKIISNSTDPLAPTELDGNEDILVDIPLNINFKKDELETKNEDSEKTEAKKTETKKEDNTNKKSSKKSRKSK